MSKSKCKKCEIVIDVDLGELEGQTDEFSMLASESFLRNALCDKCKKEKERLKHEDDQKQAEFRNEQERKMKAEQMRNRMTDINANCRLPLRFRNDYDVNLGNPELLRFVQSNYKKSLFLQSFISGVGKTRTLIYVAGQMIDREAIDIRYYKTSELMRRLAGLYMTNIPEADLLIKELREVDLFILDEFGKEKMTDRAGEWIFEILDCRYESGLPFWITSNKGGKALKEHFEDRGEYLVRRLKEMCVEWIG